MSNNDAIKEQNELLRALVRLFIDERLDSTSEKAQFLSEFDFTHDEIGDILNRDRTTISRHVGGDE